MELHLDPELLRGVPLQVCFEGFGRHWRRKAQKDHTKLYEKSVKTEAIEYFFSHDWSTSRLRKFVVLLIFFNSKPAFIASLVVSLVMSIVATCTVGPYVFWTTLPGYVTFYAVLIFWQPLRSILMRSPLVFLDKICIAQSDKDLKMQGILGIGAFLNASRHLVVLWSPNFIQRLWCTFELATFLHLGGTDRQVELFPVMVGELLCCYTVFAHSVTLFYQFLLCVVEEMETGDPESRWTQLLIVVSILTPFAYVLQCILFYFGIELVQELKDLPRQLRSFRVRDANCACCTHDHCDPQTGEEIPCDREQIFMTLRSLLDDPEDNEQPENYLDHFDVMVQEGLSPQVLKKLGHTRMPFDYLVYMVASATMQSLTISVPNMIQGVSAGTYSALRWFSDLMGLNILIFVAAGLECHLWQAGAYLLSTCPWCICRCFIIGVLPVCQLSLVLLLYSPYQISFIYTDVKSGLPMIPAVLLMLLIIALFWPSWFKWRLRKMVTSRSPVKEGHGAFF